MQEDEFSIEKMEKDYESVSIDKEVEPVIKPVKTPSKPSNVRKNLATKKEKGKMPSQDNEASTSTNSKALVPKSPTQALALPEEMAKLVPKGYTGRVIQPAKQYDVISFARAMNPDMGAQVQKLFGPETIAAMESQQTGIYITWRCNDMKHDCQRLGALHRCFCGHLLGEHQTWNGRSSLVPCKLCKCQGFNFIPSRPEDIGEFWFQRRKDFDPKTWRAKCRCKHTHEDHRGDTPFRQCKVKGCSCGRFNSTFLCVACDHHWEDHNTYFETEQMRKEQGLLYGPDYFPFSEIPELRKMVLTGEDDNEFTLSSMQKGSSPDKSVPSFQSSR